MVDQIFIGHKATLGAAGNAATGVVYGITVLALGIGLWLGDGTAANMSLKQGSKNTDGIGKSISLLYFSSLKNFKVVYFNLKLYANVFVNEAKVLFASEFKKYYESFAKNLEIAMQTQYRVFLNIGRGLYAPSIFSSPTIQRKNSRPRQNHSYHKGRW